VNETNKKPKILGSQQKHKINDNVTETTRIIKEHKRNEQET